MRLCSRGAEMHITKPLQWTVGPGERLYLNKNFFFFFLNKVQIVNFYPPITSQHLQAL